MLLSLWGGGGEGGGINLTLNDTILLYYVNSSSISGDTVVERSSLEVVVGDH